MQVKLNRNEVEELLNKDYTKEAKLVKKLGEEKGRKLIDFLSQGELRFKSIDEVSLPKLNETVIPTITETNYDKKFDEVAVPKGPDATVKTPDNELNYPYRFEFSILKDNMAMGRTCCNIDVFNKKEKVGYAQFELEGCLSIQYLGVKENVDNRLELGRKMLSMLEDIAYEAGMKSMTMGSYYPLEGEFNFEEIYENNGYKKYQTDRFPELWKDLPEKATEAEDEDGLEL